MGTAEHSESGPALNSPEWWALKIEKYLAAEDYRDRPHEFGACAAHCRGPVLDIGCCFGEFVKYLPPAYPYVGMDISPKAIELARERHPGHIFVCGSIFDAVQFFTRAFDTVLADQLLEHFEHPLKVAEKLRRIARRRLVLSVPRGLPDEGKRVGDGHLSGWEDEKAFEAEFCELGKMRFFTGASHHICAVVEV